MKIVTIFERPWGSPGQELPTLLRSLYDGNLIFPDGRIGKPFIAANFVQTLDGIVSLNIPGKASGEEISGHSHEDMFIMGLLRSYADAVLIGEQTVRQGAGHLWTPGFIYPDLEQEFHALRTELGKASLNPLNVIVSGLGRVDLDEPVFSRDDIQSVVLTTSRGETYLKDTYGERRSPRVCVLPGHTELDPQDIVKFLHDAYRVQFLLHEGGPTLLSGFLRKRMIDEFFLTVAPQIVGRGIPASRPSFSGPLALGLGDALWGSLVSVKRPAIGSHLFLRYRFSLPTEALNVGKSE